MQKTLAQHSVLTVGDWIQVAVEDDERVFDLRVKELEPSEAVSVIDTDMEAEVLVSVETEERLAQEEEEARRHAEGVARAQKEAEAAARKAQEDAAIEDAERRKRMEASACTLPEEPLSDVTSGVIACLVRFPNGERHSRRFLISDPISLLFMFVDSKGAAERDPDKYRLVTQFPRRVFERPDEGASSTQPSFGDLSLTESREVFFLEDLH